MIAGIRLLGHDHVLHLCLSHGLYLIHKPDKSLLPCAIYNPIMPMPFNNLAKGSAIRPEEILPDLFIPSRWIGLNDIELLAPPVVCIVFHLSLKYELSKQES